MNSSIYRNQITRGIYSRIARHLGVTPNHVCEVARGNRRSARVEAALQREFERIDRQVERFTRKGQKRSVEVAA